VTSPPTITFFRTVFAFAKKTFDEMSLPIAAWKNAHPKGKSIGTIRLEEVSYRDARTKYNNDPRADGPAKPVADMFNLLEPVLFVHNLVTIQSSDPVATKRCGYVERRHPRLPDNLVYKDGVDWELIKNSWVLTQITVHDLEAIEDAAVAKFAEMKYIPFTVLPFSYWARFAYMSLIDDPKAFFRTLDEMRVQTLRAELAVVEARITKSSDASGKSKKRKYID
jgi:hypothetical protein